MVAERQAADFPELFTRLRSILQPLSSRLVVKTDEPGDYYLDCPPSAKYPMGTFFGAARIQKRYVSFYLMPVYMHPELLEGISERLRKRMQGKSCFNFTRPDDELLAELWRLTHDSLERLRIEQVV